MGDVVKNTWINIKDYLPEHVDSLLTKPHKLHTKFVKVKLSDGRKFKTKRYYGFGRWNWLTPHTDCILKNVTIVQWKKIREK